MYLFMLKLPCLDLEKRLGNREKVNLRDTNDVDYVVDNLTNRKTAEGPGFSFRTAG